MRTSCKTLGLSMCFFASSYLLHLALRILCIKALPAVYPCMHRALRGRQVRGDRASPFAFYLCLSACICGCFLSVSYASPPSADVHFCLPLDFEDIRARDSIYAATKHTLNLNVGEPRTVRMIYFLPNDRPFRQEVVDSIKVTIRQIQTFFAEQMQAHGYGNKTFRFEIDSEGEPVVHRVDGQHLDEHYFDDTTGTVLGEIEQKYDLWENIYFIVIDNSTDIISRTAGGTGGSRGKNGGFGLFPSGFHWKTAAHELGHAFDMRHDFRDGAYIMSYAPGNDGLSTCHAEFLAVHPYLNPDAPIEGAQSPTIELISPHEYPAGSKSVSIQFKVSDLEGLHQIILFVRTQEPHPAARYREVKACRGLDGEKDTVVEFDYDGVIPSIGYTRLSNPAVHPIYVEVIDTDGNVGRANFKLQEISPHRIATLDEHTDRVYAVAFSPDGTTLASRSADKTARVWNVETGETIATLEGHTREVRSVAFSPDGTTLASGSFREVRLWNVVTKETIATPAVYSWVWSIAFSPDGTILAYTDWSQVRLWDVAMRHDIGFLQGHTSIISSITFSPDGTILASGSDDRTVKLWDIATGANIATFKGHTSTVNSVAFSPDGTILASGSDDRTVKLWDIATGKNIATLEGHTRWISSVPFSPDGKILVSGSHDGTIKLWDLAKKENIAILPHNSWVGSVSFAPDGMLLASGSGENIILWDIATRQNIATLEGHRDGVSSVSFFRDGTILASGSYDKTIKLWDVTTGENVITLEGHTFGVHSVAFSPYSTTLASGSRDGTVLLWDISEFDKSPMSDFNGDGAVGFGDFLLFVAQFGLSQDDEGYEARFDLDGDGTIGFGDFLIFTNDFGKKVRLSND